MSTVFGAVVCRKMAAGHVTIRELATHMRVTQKRVREVRDAGSPPAWCTSSVWMFDWLEAIDACQKTGFLPGFGPAKKRRK